MSWRWHIVSRCRGLAVRVLVSLAIVALGTMAVSPGALARTDEPGSNDIESGGEAGNGPASPSDVPLRLWVNAIFPGGLPIGIANGLSWGDYDADGFIDLFSCNSGRLWRNAGGTSWQVGEFLNTVLPPTERRYGSSFGDYNNDGLPDIGTEPRVPAWGDDRMHLLHNLGGGNFVDVAGDPAIIDVQPFGNSETLCWADVDGDGNLDAFLPVYPAWSGGPGNFFLHNLGPTGPSGDYRFTELSEPAGLDNPPGTARPEGAQIADVDLDGDPDLFSNGTVYRNVSTPGNPRFDPLTEAASGVGLRESRDEGAAFFDYDLDGDLDLIVVYITDGVRIWENRGDGTFFPAETTIVDSPMTGLNLGMSAEDWDNDGDIDFTTRGVFRRNLIADDGSRRFSVGRHRIPSQDLTSAIPSWADWDGDGDLDAAIANWGTQARLYENTTNQTGGEGAARNDVSIRVVRNSSAVPRGLETEFGALARFDDGDPQQRYVYARFTASSHGYLNQNAYALHFALPPDPSFNLAVDFPGPGSGELVRIDHHVNPALRQIDLESVPRREITVYRCGQVALGSVIHQPDPLADRTLTTTAGGLALPTATEGLPDPVAAPEENWYTGLVFDTSSGSGQLLVKEIIVDGVLDDPDGCGDGDFNLALWDVSRPSDPVLMPGGMVAARSPDRNRRTSIRTDLILQPNRKYRLVARVRSLRTTTVDTPVQDGPIRTEGSIAFASATPCDGAPVSDAHVKRDQVTMALRFASLTGDGTADPVGDSLRLARDPEGRTILDWADVEAASNQVMRCDATGGACQPAHLALASTSEYSDAAAPAGPGTVLWYRVHAVNACTAEVLGGAP